MNIIHYPSRQHGLTLVEIMVALAIGAFLLAGLLQIFTSTKQTYRVQENMSRIQENARFAMDFLSYHIRMAGYTYPGQNLSFIVLASCDRDSETCTDGDEGDTITVRYEANQDCLGNNLTGGNVAVNTFFIANNRLMYNGNGGGGGTGPQPLVENVDDIEILYGIDTNGDKGANRYGNAPAGNDTVSVRLTITLRSPEDNIATEMNQGDYRLRRQFTTTIKLRNDL